MCYGMNCKYEAGSGDCTWGGEKFPSDAACMDPLDCTNCPYEVTGGDCQGECQKELEDV